MDEITLPDGVPGRLFATGFTNVGPDPGAALGTVGADTLICLITDHEIDLRFPHYHDWLTEPASGAIVRRYPTPDWGVTDDEAMAAAVREVATMLREGRSVVTHCGAGMGRTGVLCILVLSALGVDPDEAARQVRRERPGSGPESEAQIEQVRRLRGVWGE